jgi:capsular polysaccharide biosynthesis protein
VEFRDFLAIVWKRRLVVAIVFVVAIALASAYAFSQPKQYKSTATIIFTPDAKQGADFLSPDNLNALLATYAELAKSDQNKARADVLLGHKVPGSISTSTVAGSGVLQVSGTDTDPHGAADTASATARALMQAVQGNGVLIASLVNAPYAARTRSCGLRRRWRERKSRTGPCARTSSCSPRRAPRCFRSRAPTPGTASPP